MTLAPRAVLVHRRSELDELLARHATRGQAEFFLRARGRTLAEVEARHDAVQAARTTVAAAVPLQWRRAEVERVDLARFAFEAEDLVVVVGQDGLVANVAKYLAGQPVLGVDPEPGRNAGVLVAHRPEHAADLLVATAAGRAAVRSLTMVEARCDDGRVLLALNEVYVGHASHQTARWILGVDGVLERQASSGLVVATGTGATGWCASIARERRVDGLPEPQEERLAWFVREAWPSPATRVDRTAGALRCGETLDVVAESDRLVVFGDGIEADRIELTWGQSTRVGVASQRFNLLA
ncbi:MAG: hypothetical protein ACT4QF_13490 [Sporichthyaceae bacterium]